MPKIPNGFYMLFPRHAYYLMELIENHAYHTYDDYLNAHEAALKAQPAPQVAIDYYLGGDLYLFEEFQTASEHEFRHPKLDNLYDVFINIREDECAHVKTMEALQAPEARQSFRSPHTLSVATKVLSTVETETNLFELSATASPHPEASP